MTVEEVRDEIESRQRSCIETINVGYGNKDYEQGCHDTYDEILEFLDDIEQTNMDEVIKALGESIGVPADYCGSEAKSYIIGYRKALFDIRENWNKRGNR